MAKKEVSKEIKEMGEQFIRKLDIVTSKDTDILVQPSWAVSIKCILTNDGKAMPKGYIGILKPKNNLLPLDVIIENPQFEEEFEIVFLNPLNHPITVKPKEIIGNMVLIKSI